MGTTARIGSGSSIALGDGTSPEQFPVLYQAVTIGEVGFELDEVDATDFSSTAYEYVLDIPNPITIEVTANWDPTNATHVAWAAAAAAKVVKNFKVITSAASPNKFTFAGLIKNFKIGLSIHGINVMKCSVRMSGALTGPSA